MTPTKAKAKLAAIQKEKDKKRMRWEFVQMKLYVENQVNEVGTQAFLEAFSKKLKREKENK